MTEHGQVHTVVRLLSDLEVQAGEPEDPGCIILPRLTVHVSDDGYRLAISLLAKIGFFCCSHFGSSYGWSLQ